MMTQSKKDISVSKDSSDVAHGSHFGNPSVQSLGWLSSSHHNVVCQKLCLLNIDV